MRKASLLYKGKSKAGSCGGSCIFAGICGILAGMKRYIQHEFLKVSHFTATQWQHPLHNHNHFEIIFVHRGKGFHCCSGMHYPYSGQTLFLLAPADVHRFIIEEETEFTFLKFTNVYLNGVGNLPDLPAWKQNIDEVLIQARSKNQPILNNEADTEKAQLLVMLIVKEWQDTNNETSQTLFFLMQALLTIIRRNIQLVNPGTDLKHSEKITLILNYLHQYLFTIEQVKIEHLAEVFGYSKNYLGEFFKQQTGQTLRNYISHLKIQLIKNRLQYSYYSIKEISQELGFTDMSHFNKFFKNHAGITPSEFRRSASSSEN